MFGSTYRCFTRARRVARRTVRIVLMVCLLPSQLAAADEGVFTEEELPFSETYSGAMLIDSSGSQLRVSHSEGEAVGRLDSITGVEWFHAIRNDHGGIWFTDYRVLLSNDAKWGGNLGFGYRCFLEDFNRIVGASYWYDVDDTHRRTFHQVGVGLETLGENWDWRTNIYIPIADTEQTVDFSPVNSRFSGNLILLDRTRFDELAMKGVDMEAGVPILGDFGDAYNLRGFAGWYYFSADGGDDTLGVSGRIEGRVTPDLALRVAITNDDVFDTNIVFGATWYLPDGRHTDEISPTMSQYDRLEQRVHRNDHIVVEETATAETFAATDPTTGQQIRVVHVNSDADPGGDGSVSSPFQTLAEAQAASGPGNIILAHADSFFDSESITLQANQRFLGEGESITHRVDTLMFGSILLPRASAGTALPEIADSPGNAVTLSSGTEVSGFTITDPAAAGIFADGVSGDVSIANATITGSTGTGIDVQSSSGTITFTNTAVNDSSLAGVNLANNTGTINFTDLTVDNNTSGASGLVATNGGTLNIDGSSSIEASNQVAVNITGTTLDVTFDRLESTNSATAGIALDNVSGNFVVTGTSRVTNANGTGVSVQNSTADVTFNSIDVDGADRGILLVDNTGSFTVGADGTFIGDGGTIKNLTNNGNGISITNATNVSIRFMNIDAGSGNDAVEVIANGANDTSVLFDNMNILAAVNRGVDLNSAGSGTLRALITNSSISTTNEAVAAATSAAGGSLELALNGNVLSSTDQAAVDLDGSAGGTLTVTSLSGNQVLGNTTGDGGIIAETVLFDADTTMAGIQQVAGGDTNIGSIGTRVTGDGLRLDQVTGDLAFGNLDIFNDSGTGLFVRSAGTFNLTNTGGTVDTTNGTAMDVDPVTLNSTFDRISSTDSGGHGIILDQVSGNFTVTGTTTISGAADAGIRIANVTDAATNLSFGSVNITNGNDLGIEFDSVAGTAAFGNTTIGVPLGGVNSGIRVLNSSGNFTFATTDITDGGVELLNSTGRFAAGGGTIANSIGTGIDVTLGSVDAIFTDTNVTANSGAPAVNVNLVTGGSLVIGGTGTVTAQNLLTGLGGISIDAANSSFTAGITDATVDGNGGVGIGLSVRNLAAGGSVTIDNLTTTDVATDVDVQNSTGTVTVNGVQENP